MYSALKNIALYIVPKSFLFKNEIVLRKLFLWKYKGDTFQCNICKTRLKEFIPLGKNDLLCPLCGSRSRTRRLWHLLQDSNLITGNVLHFSPPRSLYRLLKKNKSITYTATDFENEFLADYALDITNMNLPEQSQDLIICYHILEHIENDAQAIKELYRVLKPTGKCFIQTPFKNGAIYEDATITKPADRLKAFGQEDHVRIYSLDGLVKRLEEAHFKAKKITYTSEENHINGWASENIIMVSR